METIHNQRSQRELEASKHQKLLEGLDTLKTINRTSNIGLAGGLGMMGAAGYKKNLPLGLAGASTAFLSGFTKRRANKAEKENLGRVKKYFSTLIEREKRASDEKGPLAKSISWVLNKVPFGLGTKLPFGTSTVLPIGQALEHAGLLPHGSTAPLVIAGDIGSITDIADSAIDQTSKITGAVAKHSLGKATNDDFKNIAKGYAGLAAEEKFKSLPVGIKKDIARYPYYVFHKANASGATLGQYAAKLLKPIDKYDPKFVDNMIEALQKADYKRIGDLFKDQEQKFGPATQQTILNLKQSLNQFPELKKTLLASGENVDSFINKLVQSKGQNIQQISDRILEASKNVVKMQKNITEGIDSIPGVRKGLRMFGGNLNKTIEEAVKSNMATGVSGSERLKKIMQGTGRGIKTMGLGALIAATGYGIGGLRKNRSLANNDTIKDILALPEPELKKTGSDIRHHPVL